MSRAGWPIPLAVALLMAPTGALAQDVRAWSFGEFARLAFDWGEPTEYSVDVAPDRVTIVFASPVENLLTHIADDLADYVSSVDVDDSSIVLRTPRPMVVNDLMDGGRVYFDMWFAADVAETQDTPGASTEPAPGAIATVSSDIGIAPPAGEAPAEPTAGGVRDERPVAEEAAPIDIANLPVINVRAGEHVGYSRVVFDWDGPVGYEIERIGETVVARFERAAMADTTMTRAMALSQVIDVRQISEGGPLEVAIVIQPSTRVRQFTGDARVVIDVIATGARVAPIPVAVAVERVDGAPPELPVDRLSPPIPPRRPESGGSAVQSATAVAETEPTAATDAAVAPAADTGRTPPLLEEVPPETTELFELPPSRQTAGTVAVDAAAADVAPPPTVVEEAPEPADEVAIVEDPVPAEALETEEAEAAAAGADADQQQVTTVEPQAAEAEPLRVFPDRAAPQTPVAVFQPGQPAAAAVFRRADSLWVVFASASPLDADRLAAQVAGVLGDAEAVPVSGGVALRFAVDEAEHVAVSRSALDWEVAVGGPPQPPAAPLTVESRPNHPRGGRLEVPTESAEIVLSVVDPEVGDELIVVPLTESGAGVVRGRRFVELSVLASAQGLVIKPRADDIRVELADAGVEVVASDGLQISRPSETERHGSVTDGDGTPQAASAGPFDFEAWVGSANHFNDRRVELLRAAAMMPEDRRADARLDLARFLVSHGYGPEARGVIRLIEQSEPALAGRWDVVALRGVAHAISGDAEAALEDLTQPVVNDEPGAAVWRGLANAELGRWRQAAQAFDMAGAAVPGLPAHLLERVARPAAEAALETGDLEAAESYLDLLFGDRSTTNQPGEDYLRGRVAFDRGDSETAAELWQGAAAGHDRFYRFRAEMALIDLAREAGTLAPGEEIDRLEALRFTWRGDHHEFALLERLGEAYWRVGDHRTAVSFWENAVALFPDLDAATALQASIEQRLTALLASGQIEQVSPLTAATLFEEYGERLPDGAERNALIERLAEQLADIDLLGRAADLLAGLVDDHPPGADRSRIGTRLAAIRLLDGQPQAALAALDRSRSGAETEEQLAARRLLRARALSELNRSDEALALLELDDTRMATAARLDIAWREQDWPTAAHMLEDLVGPPPVLGEPITEDQARLALNHGIALALSEDRAGLDRLAAMFGPAMAESPHANAFAVLTRESETPDAVVGIASVRRQVAEVDMFQEFLSNYRELTAASTATN